MTDRLRVAVIGCGTAGAATALFLARAGHEVTLFERVPEPGPVGAGIMMQPSGLLVLERLELAAEIVARGARVERLHCETAEGRTVLDLRYEALAPGLFGLGLHRGVLFETLHRALLASRAQVCCGVAIARVVRAPSDRVALEDDAGIRRGPFDLIAVCDGARSRVRDSMPALSGSVRPYPWGALWFIGRAPDGRHEGRLHQIVRGAQKMIGLLPTGLGPGHGRAPLVSLFASIRADAVDAARARGLGAFRQVVLDLAPSAAPVLDQIRSFDDLTFAAYFDVALPRWHAHRVVLLGDAAHATSPQLGQGCNLALVDAADLADALAAAPDVPTALERYTATRRDHLAYYQLATRSLTPFFQSDIPGLGALRDALLGPLSAIPFVGREMVRSMCGTKTGILFGSRETRMPG
jgi:2-polyprenyl-6-methoxyphenol hydroxylase-like FAD-dependent oxidoreductase